jgi:D-alanyl-D-alanine carboxypeptidase
MFSLLVALTMYLTMAPAHPALTAADFRPPQPQASLPLAAETERSTPADAPTKKDENRLGVETSARAVMVADWRTGASLFEKNADNPQPIASISKLVTALTVLELEPEWNAVVEAKAGDERGGMPYLLAGEQVTVRDLFNMMLVQSSNGASVALARATGLTPEEFAARMNAAAEAAGMQGASFEEPTGLSANNVATAADVVALLRKALSKDEIRDAVAQREYRLTTLAGVNHTFRSTDELLGSFIDRDPYRFLGGKTGFIGEAGYCFGAAAENADGNGVIAVVLGAPDKPTRFKEVKSLMYWAFDAYEWPRHTASGPRTVGAN